MRDLQRGGAGSGESRATNHGTLASVHGQTEGVYNGGPWTIAKQKVARSKGCIDCPDDCVRATGTVVAKYFVAVNVQLPDVPDGLSECEDAAMRKFISTTLRKHENEHKRRMETYNGTTTRAINMKGCGADAITERINDQQKVESAERERKARELSDAIDPYNVSIPTKCDG